MATVHPITGRTTITLGGEVRRLAFDMNMAAALDESVGNDWNLWLAKRFLGEAAEGGRLVTPLTVRDTITVLYAALATDREDSGVQETEASLRRSVSPLQLAEVQMALMKTVLAGFGVAGEGIEALLTALATPRSEPARGTGTESSGSPSVPSGSAPNGSGGSASPSGGASSRGTRTASKRIGARKRGSSRTSS